MITSLGGRARSHGGSRCRPGLLRARLSALSRLLQSIRLPNRLWRVSGVEDTFPVAWSRLRGQYSGWRKSNPTILARAPWVQSSLSGATERSWLGRGDQDLPWTLSRVDGGKPAEDRGRRRLVAEDQRRGVVDEAAGLHQARSQKVEELGGGVSGPECAPELRIWEARC